MDEQIATEKLTKLQQTLEELFDNHEHRIRGSLALAAANAQAFAVFAEQVGVDFTRDDFLRAAGLAYDSVVRVWESGNGFPIAKA